MPKDRVCWPALFDDWRHDRGRRKDGGSGNATKTALLGGIGKANEDKGEQVQNVAVKLLLSHDGRCTFCVPVI